MDWQSPYLLSGLATCGACGGALIAATRQHGGQRVGVYVFGHRWKRGRAVCGNGLAIRQTILDEAILDRLADVLDRDIMRASIREALRRLRAGEVETRADREAIAGEIREIDARLARGVRLLLDGAVPTEQLRAALDEDEKRKAVSVRHALAVSHQAVGTC